MRNLSWSTGYFLLAAGLAFGQSSATSVSTAIPVSVADTLKAQDNGTEAHTKSVTFSFSSKSEVMNNFRGGKEARADFLGNITLGVGLDFEQLVGLPGSSALIQGLGVYGSQPSEAIGDIQGASNLSGPHAFKLFQAWLQQNLFDDRLSVLVGLHDLASEFGATDSSDVFINSSFGIGPELSRSGKNGPSIFPTTAMAGRIRVNPLETVQVSAAIYDGIPGDPDHPEGTHIMMGGEDGVFGISEIAFSPLLSGLKGKYAVGAWTYSRASDDLSETDELGVPVQAKSLGTYLLLDQRVYAPDPARAQGLSAFLRLGWAAANTNSIEYAGQGGLVYTGLFAPRPEDQLGIGAAVARAGSHYRDAAQNKGQEIRLYEASFELTYRARIFSWLRVTPDLQWIKSPAMNPALADAFVGSTRMEVAF